MKKDIILLGLIFLLGLFLRFYKLAEDPPGLYIDEAAIGYNAYKILTTGKDEYGVPHPLAFRSFGDYKPPVYIYVTAGVMKLFGENEFSVRFTSALFGSLSVILLYLFVKDLVYLDRGIPIFKNKKITGVFPLLSAFLLAVSPWHLQFSRGGFEVTLASFLFILACWLALLFYKSEHIWFLLGSTVIFSLSVYTYHTYRILTPLVVFLVYLVLIFLMKKQRKNIVAAFVGFSLLILPFVLFSFTPMGSERFAATSSFAEYSAPSLQDKVTIYPMVFVKNYLSFYSLDFLFNFGDGIGRHQIPNFGVLPRWTFPFYLLGLFTLFSLKKRRSKYIILTLFFLSPVAAAIARPSPHSLRDLLFIFPAVITIAIGILAAYSFIPKKLLKVSISLVILVVLYETGLYFHYYYVHYPKTDIIDWGGGYKQIVLDAKPLRNKYKKIVIDNNLKDAMIYFRFYDDSDRPEFVNASWKKPEDWNFPVLYIRPYYGQHYSDKIIHNIFIPTVNHDIFAQFWEI